MINWNEPIEVKYSGVWSDAGVKYIGQQLVLLSSLGIEYACEKDSSFLQMGPQMNFHSIVTHTCPTSIEEIIGNPRTLQQYGLDNFTSKTNEFLQCMLDVHRPSVWVFGHFHTSWNKSIGGTEFRCLNELEAFKL